ncbi:MAG: nuclear transport factor 2 family protein [Rhodobacteraceae bacterium]|jgi:ketosteroid isomerase-like protein|nr:nuclear transport factor 2 family protein [Paracoccaceae bacterium]
MEHHVDTLQGLIDRTRIAEVIHAYCLRFDRAEPEAVAALFTDDAVVDYGPEFPALHGRAAILPAVAQGLATRFAATSHHVSNLIVTFDGPDAADTLCHLYAWHRYRDGSRDGELWGQYAHRFIRTEQGWKIARLRLMTAGSDGFHRTRMHGIGRRADIGQDTQ